MTMNKTELRDLIIYREKQLKTVESTEIKFSIKNQIKQLRKELKDRFFWFPKRLYSKESKKIINKQFEDFLKTGNL